MNLLVSMQLQNSLDDDDPIATPLRGGVTTVPAGDLIQGQPAVVRLFDRIGVLCGNDVITCRFAFQPQPLRLEFSGWADVAAFRDDNERAFVADFYFEMSSGAAFGYSSRQASISVVTAKTELLEAAEVEQWDSAFEAMVSTADFGAAGEAYVRSLLRQIPEPRRSRLLNAVGPRAG
jgi:hypothetical protein